MFVLYFKTSRCYYSEFASSQQLYGWGWFFNLFLSDIAASDLSIQFKLRKRGFLLNTLSRTIIFQWYSTSVKRVSLRVFSVIKICIYYRSCYVQAHEKNAKKLTMNNVLNEQGCFVYDRRQLVLFCYIPFTGYWGSQVKICKTQ